MSEFIYRNLVPGQWQIGNIIMGRGTNIIVETVDAKSYDVNAQDYQVPRADENRFGFDQLKPTTIEFTLDVLHDRLLPLFEDSIPNFWHDFPSISDLAREWRGDDIRNIWGAMKPLYVCSKLDELPKIIYGRPGQFATTADDDFHKGEVVKVTAEFRRGDTFAYSLDENAVLLDESTTTVVVDGTNGQGPSWLRILLAGPITHPIFLFSNLFNQTADITIDLDYTVSDGEVVEINAYPWTRRVVNSSGINLAANLIGATPYLDRLRFDFDAAMGVTMLGSGMSADTEALVLWRDVYTVI